MPTINSFIYDMKNGNNADDTAQRNFKNRMSLQGHATNDGDMYI